ncbi:MAG: metallophosphoesterase [Acaryochloris sp. SU_5_25]|nr:metallophosphoesterase [Acaryochloris sp. SU_5_25]
MQLVTDPSISQKIQKMRERVRWQHPLCLQHHIDQTQLVIEDGAADQATFSFLVVGDSGAGRHRGDSPQRRVAESMLKQGQDCRFILHTGDVIYLVGSSEQYFENFIEPYRDFLVGGETPQKIVYDQMVFKWPMLPVPGNHDYYDLPLILGLLSQATRPIRCLFQAQLNLDLGWHGSCAGDAYARAFLDYLKCIDNAQLQQHLQQHYTAITQTGTCLRYQPGQFTRLPNRYYTFRYSGIDFFALDSNTFNSPQPLPKGRVGEEQRRQLESKRKQLEQKRLQLLEDIPKTLNDTSDNGESDSDQLDDLYAKAEQIAEQLRDIDKQLAASGQSELDLEQLNWLEQRLIASWRDPEARGRIIFFHHPPYVTEATKWNQGQTLAVRKCLQRVFDVVQTAISPLPENRSLVDLILNGHAHCLEYLCTRDTGHADAHLNWIVCGGSGFSLRRQRLQGPDLLQDVPEKQVIAQSKLFVGRHGHGSQKRRPYSYVRIDVGEGCPPQMTVRPFVVECVQNQWQDYPLSAFVI